MKKEITEIFGNRLKQLRIENNYTMDELTDLYNEKFNGKLNKGAISRYENNLQEPKFTTANNFSKLFSVSISWLMGEDVPKYLNASENSKTKTQDSPSFTKEEIELVNKYRKLSHDSKMQIIGMIDIKLQDEECATEEDSCVIRRA